MKYEPTLFPRFNRHERVHKTTKIFYSWVKKKVNRLRVESDLPSLPHTFYLPYTFLEIKTP